MTTLHLRKSIGPKSFRGCLLVALALVCFALVENMRAVSPAPDGGYPNQNTAEGAYALFSLTTGLWNTALGFQALYADTTGLDNTATGGRALFNNTTGNGNTANGAYALYYNTVGHSNSAFGWAALALNTSGIINTAIGYYALANNTTGSGNVGTGWQALWYNTTGGNNAAYGSGALHATTTGSSNTGLGGNALDRNTSGSYNTGVGSDAGGGATGNNNIALGALAGINLTTGDNNIDIGNQGNPGEANTIRVGMVGTQTNTFIAGISGVTVAGGVGVIIDSNGHLGTVVSSERFKDAIKPMDKASEAILALRPVTFRYKHELDPHGIPQFGLVAEEVEKVNPDLVARDAEGKVYTVRYEAVNAMLLNEFLKEHRRAEELKCAVAKQEATITQLRSDGAKQETIAAQQQQEIRALTASLKEQARQIQKVSDQLELSKPAPRTVVNN